MLNTLITSLIRWIFLHYYQRCITRWQSRESFDIQAIKSRSIALENFLTADSNQPFVHVSINLLQGRAQPILKQAGHVLFQVLRDLKFEGKISLEIREMEPELYWK